MKTLSEKKMEQSIEEAKRMYNYNEPHGEVKWLDAEFCHNLDKEEFATVWTEFQLVSGLVNKFISESGLQKCKKSEATCLLVVGQKSKNNLFVSKKYKNYWLKP